MPYDPFARVRIGRTDVEVTRLGFGSASIGGLFRAVDDDQAIATVKHAWDLRWPIPAGLWDDLRSEALIDPEAPTPT